MLLHAQQRDGATIGIFFGKPGRDGIGSFVDFRDEDERAAGFRDAEDFVHITGQVGPPEVGFHGGDEIEHGVWKRQLRNGGVADLDAAEIDPSCVGSRCCGDALFGIIDAVDFPVRGEGCQLTDGPATAATYVEDGVVIVDRNVLQAPVGQPGMAGIHAPQREAAEPSRRLAALIFSRARGCHSGSPRETV